MIANKSLEGMAKFRYLATKATTHNCIHKELRTD